MFPGGYRKNATYRLNLLLTFLKVTLLHGCFSRFLNCTSATNNDNIVVSVLDFQCLEKCYEDLLRWSSYLVKLLTGRPATILKKNSITRDLLHIFKVLQNGITKFLCYI